MVVSISFTGANDCKNITATAFDAPKEPKITGFSYSVPQAQCGNSQYAVMGSISFENQRGNLQIQDENGVDIITPQVVSSPFNFTTNLIDADGAATHKLHILWAETGCELDTTTYTAPAEPQISSLTVSPTTASCDDPNYSLNIEFNYLNMNEADLQFSVDGVVMPHSGTMPNYTISGLSSTSKKAVAVRAFFNKTGMCEQTVTYDEPLVPSVLSATASTTSLQCGETEYDLSLNISFANLSGETLTITDNGTTLLTTDTVTTSPFVYTITSLTTDEKAHDITVDFGSCSKLFTALYTAPQKLICLHYYDTICHGESYDKNGFTATLPSAGDHTIVSGNDSLELHVISVPQMTLSAIERQCQTNTEIEIPYSISDFSSSAEVSYSIFGTTDSQSLTAASGTLTISLPANTAAGKYTLSATITDADGRCSSTSQLQVDLAIDNLMYRKWTDVIFIDNHDSLFVGYQWYKDGKQLAGETSQRLYDQNGLQGGTYYCELTTTDNQTWYTCEQQFDDIVPSASVEQKDMQLRIMPSLVRAAQDVSVERTENQALDIEVFNQLGSKVAQYHLDEQQMQIAAPSTAGVYIIKATNAEGTSRTEKLIVK